MRGICHWCHHHMVSGDSCAKQQRENVFSFSLVICRTAVELLFSGTFLRSWKWTFPTGCLYILSNMITIVFLSTKLCSKEQMILINSRSLTIQHFLFQYHATILKWTNCTKWICVYQMFFRAFQKRAKASTKQILNSQLCRVISSSSNSFIKCIYFFVKIAKLLPFI